jgi:hypothetical protein
MKPELRKPNYKISAVVIKLLFLWILIGPYSFPEYRLQKKVSEAASNKLTLVVSVIHVVPFHSV